MLAPFSPLVPTTNAATYEGLAAAAKALRVDPAGYRPYDGIGFEQADEALYWWEISDGPHVLLTGILGVFPLQQLIPHEATTAAALTRPRYPVQIRPVMALTEGALPAPHRIGASRSFDGRFRHVITPVECDVAGIADAVIADGHHRTVAALRDGGDPGIMTLLVGTSGATLHAGAFHRVFAHPVDLHAALEGFDVRVEAPADSLAAGRVAVESGEVNLGVTPSGPLADRYRGIPAGWVHEALLPALGLDEVDAVYLDEIPAALSAGRYGTAIGLPGADVEAVVAGARSGLALPPKATRFRPKPLRGFAMRAL
jgi:hypothetical protein